MDWLTFVSKLVEALAWPAIVVWLLWYLKEHLPTLASSIRKLKVSGVEMEFERQAQKLAEEAQEALPSEDFAGEDPDLRRLREFARINANLAINEGWFLVESAAIKLLAKANINMPRGPHLIYEGLVKLDVLTPPQISAFKQLRELRSKAAQGSDLQLAPESVDNYIVSAVAMAAYLEDSLQYVKDKAA